MNNKWSKYLLVLLPLLLAVSAGAQEAQAVAAAAEKKGGIMEWMLNNLVIVVGAIVIAGGFAALTYVNNMLLQVQKIRLLQELGADALEEVKLLSRESMWRRFYKRITRVVPVDKEKDVMFNHDYDGIRELDNVLPPWWVALFYVTIAFSAVYLVYYHVSGTGLTSTEEYESAMKEAEESVKAYLATRADLVDENTVELLQDPSQVALGESIFQSKCTPCHGTKGEGNTIGPNLTDEYWINGGGINNVFKTIKYGVPEKGMISWQSQLPASDMQRVASFILSLQGTNPPNAKAAQGDLWKPEATPTQAENVMQDTTKVETNN